MLDNFRYQYPIKVRFADLDVLGHLNNATYLTYIESARIQYLEDVCGRRSGGWNTLGMILARTEIDYRLPIAYEDTVVVYVRVARLGGKSFDMLYAITKQGDTDDAPVIAAEAKTVMVSYDYRNDTSQAVPADWRTKMTAYEPALA
ncbi:MAG: thioesterase family protein [Chloroflexota bacterium]